MNPVKNPLSIQQQHPLKSQVGRLLIHLHNLQDDQHVIQLVSHHANQVVNRQEDRALSRLVNHPDSQADVLPRSPVAIHPRNPLHNPHHNRPINLSYDPQVNQVDSRQDSRRRNHF
jgi:hypothetical protein